MTQPHVNELIELLQLERLEDNLFRGQSRDIGTRYVFGGQVLGQALSAAQQTVDAERAAHSLHAYFLRAGDVEAPIVYRVNRARDGHSFSVRRVEAIQHGQPILNCAVSFQDDEPGFEHQTSMPEVPKPEDLAAPTSLPEAELAKLPPKLQRWLSTDGPFEYRFVWPRDELHPPKRPAYQHIWFRLTQRIEATPALHRALLAYASDYHLIGTALLPHGVSYLTPNLQMASLDHALWFHRPFRVDEWLLYSCESPTAQGARIGARPDVRSFRQAGGVHRAGRAVAVAGSSRSLNRHRWASLSANLRGFLDSSGSSPGSAPTWLQGFAGWTDPGASREKPNKI
jgi:acyl-CoA thioesterase-2